MELAAAYMEMHGSQLLVETKHGLLSIRYFIRGIDYVYTGSKRSLCYEKL